jgi:hypothetical protein
VESEPTTAKLKDKAITDAVELRILGITDLPLIDVLFLFQGVTN